MIYAIDRIDGGFCVCESIENGSKLMVAQSNMPADAAEGDLFELTGSDVTMLPEQTAKRKAAVKKRLQSLFDEDNQPRKKNM